MIFFCGSRSCSHLGAPKISVEGTRRKPVKVQQCSTTQFSHSCVLNIRDEVTDCVRPKPPHTLVRLLFAVPLMLITTESLFITSSHPHHQCMISSVSLNKNYLTAMNESIRRGACSRSSKSHTIRHTGIQTHKSRQTQHIHDTVSGCSTQICHLFPI